MVSRWRRHPAGSPDAHAVGTTSRAPRTASKPRVTCSTCTAASDGSRRGPAPAGHRGGLSRTRKAMLFESISRRPGPQIGSRCRAISMSDVEAPRPPQMRVRQALGAHETATRSYRSELLRRLQADRNRAAARPVGTVTSRALSAWSKSGESLTPSPDRGGRLNRRRTLRCGE